MGKEIEGKFLVKKELLPSLDVPCWAIKQGYLSYNPEVRVRHITYEDGGRSGFITVKGNGTLVRSEYDYFIDDDEALEMLDLCLNILTKKRYILDRWEVDVFEGDLDGLILAEIELYSEDEQLGELPEWVGEEVTEDSRYKNKNLHQLKV